MRFLDDIAHQKIQLRKTSDEQYKERGGEIFSTCNRICSLSDNTDTYRRGKHRQCSSSLWSSQPTSSSLWSRLLCWILPKAQQTWGNCGRSSWFTIVFPFTFISIVWEIRLECVLLVGGGWVVSSWQVRPKKKLPASTSSSSSPLSTSSSSPHNQNQCWTANGHNMVIIKYINIVLIIINILIRRSHNPQHGDDDHYHQHQDGCNWCTHPQRQSQSSLSASSSPVNKNQYFIFYLGINKACFSNL